MAIGLVVAARTEFRTFTEAARDLAARKRLASRARREGTRPGKESPREVYLNACATIGAYLEAEHGFKYSKSGPRVRRRIGDFIFEISFQSDRNNIAGERIGLWIHATVLSRRMKDWRSSQPLLYAHDRVCGGQIGNLQADHSWIDWELVVPEERGRTICDAIDAIEELVIPYFARFENLPSLCGYLVREELPGMVHSELVEFLMCFANQEMAWEAAANALLRQSELIPIYLEHYERYGVMGLTGQLCWGGVDMLAFASHAFQLGNVLTRAKAGVP